jgi:hypothetical protein
MVAHTRSLNPLIQRGVRFLLLVVVVLFLVTPSESHDTSTPAGSAMKEGGLAFQRGAFGEALSHWKQAADLYKGAGNKPGTGRGPTSSRPRLGWSLGQSKQALQSLELALAAAHKSDDPLP